MGFPTHVLDIMPWTEYQIFMGSEKEPHIDKEKVTEIWWEKILLGSQIFLSTFRRPNF